MVRTELEESLRAVGSQRRQGSVLEAIILAAGDGGFVGIDLALGCFVRAIWGADAAEPALVDLVPEAALASLPAGESVEENEPVLRPAPLVEGASVELAPYSVVRGVIADPNPLFDPARPEAVVLEGPPNLASPMRKGSIRRRLKALLAPPEQPLLGFLGPSVPYWELAGTRGSLALVELRRGPQILRRSGEHQLRARFSWAGVEQELPVLDPRLARSLWGVRRFPLSGAAIAKRAGFLPRFLLVALTGPRRGHCYKVVAAALPSP